MTTQELEQEYEAWVRGPGILLPRTWARFVVEVVIPRVIADHDEELYVMDHGKPSGLDRSTRREKESRDRGYY